MLRLALLGFPTLILGEGGAAPLAQVPASHRGAQPGTVQLVCVELHEAPRALAQR